MVVSVTAMRCLRITTPSLETMAVSISSLCSRCPVRLGKLRSGTQICLWGMYSSYLSGSGWPGSGVKARAGSSHCVVSCASIMKLASSALISATRHGSSLIFTRVGIELSSGFRGRTLFM